jgi:hypothetical protein
MEAACNTIQIPATPTVFIIIVAILDVNIILNNQFV